MSVSVRWLHLDGVRTPMNVSSLWMAAWSRRWRLLRCRPWRWPGRAGPATSPRSRLFDAPAWPRYYLHRAHPAHRSPTSI